MADRTHGAMPPPNAGAVLDALLGRLESLEGQVKALQARQAQALPADWRFVLDGDTVKIRRVSTGEECTLCGSEIGSCPVTVSLSLTTGPDQFCITYAMTGFEFLAPTSAVFAYEVGPPPPVRPPLPPPGAGWLLAGAAPTTALAATSICDDYGFPATTATFQRLELRGTLGGGVSIYIYQDGVLSPGSPGNNAFSVDGGVTWGTDVSIAFEVPCITPPA